MTDLGLILLGHCGAHNKPLCRHPRRFTWDLVADLGILGTLDVLRGRPVVYLSSMTQSNIEITKLVSPVDHRPCINNISIDERFINCGIEEISSIIDLIRGYADSLSSEFDVPIERIESMLNRQLNMSTIVVAPTWDIDGEKHLHIFTNDELREVLPRDKYDKITDPTFEDTAIIHDHIPYMVAMSTKYKESDNIWFLKKFAHQCSPDIISKLIGTMLAITRESAFTHEDCDGDCTDEGPVVAVILDRNKPYGHRLVDLHAHDKKYANDLVSNIVNSVIKPGYFRAGSYAYRLLFAYTLDDNAHLIDSDHMIYDPNILDLMDSKMNCGDLLSMEEKKRIFQLLQRNTIGPVKD